MIKKTIYILIILSFCGVNAQNIDSLFQKANDAYHNAFYEEALHNYHKIDSLKMQSADLYYNLGNTYYKLNQIAPSIYYYEKALLLDPKHEDAKQNLTFAQRMTIDAFEMLPKSLFQKINETIIYPVSYNIWAWITIVFAFSIGVFFLLYHFSEYANRKRLYFGISLISIGLFLLSLIFVIKAKHHSNRNQPAIVFSAKVSVKSEPNNKASETFELHEGTKVQVLEKIDSWFKIKLIDGKIGWLKEDTIKNLK